MSAEDVMDRVLRTAADVFGVDAKLITPASTPQDVEGWDSINHLNLVLALEQEFGTSFTPDEIAHLDSIKAIADVVGKK